MKLPDLGTNLAVFLIIVAYAVLAWVLDQSFMEAKRNYMGLGLYYGANYTINNLRDCSTRGLPVDSFNARMKFFTDSLREELDLEYIDISF